MCYVFTHCKPHVNLRTIWVSTHATNIGINVKIICMLCSNDSSAWDESKIRVGANKRNGWKTLPCENTMKIFKYFESCPFSSMEIASHLNENQQFVLAVALVTMRGPFSHTNSMHVHGERMWFHRLIKLVCVHLTVYLCVCVSFKPKSNISFLFLVFSRPNHRSRLKCMSVKKWENGEGSIFTPMCRFRLSPDNNLSCCTQTPWILCTSYW